MNNLTLVSHPLCPYVQRAAIALAEKEVAFDRRTVDLSDKPGWFRDISPLGKVPLLKVETGRDQTATLFESTVILEYLEETQPNGLHPRDPLERAQHRSWIEFGSSILNAIARFYSARDEKLFMQEVEVLSGMFVRVEEQLGEGPWFAGARFSLVDAVYGPIFRYFDVFDTIDDFGILANKPKQQSWRQQLLDRPSVRNAVSSDYPEQLKAFLITRKSALSARMATQCLHN